MSKKIIILSLIVFVFIFYNNKFHIGSHSPNDNCYYKPIKTYSSFFKESPKYSAFKSHHFQNYFDKLSNSYLTTGNHLDLLPDHESYDKKIQLIKSAKESIFITIYQLNCDEDGISFVDELINAKKRGVDVKIVLNGGLIYSYLLKDCDNRLKENNIEVLFTPQNYLEPIKGSPIYGDKSWEMHEKIFIVDYLYAITGGQNIGNYWSRSNGENKYFIDTDIFVEGPVVLSMLERFISIYKRLSPDSINIIKYSNIIIEKKNKLKSMKLIGKSNYLDWFNKKSLDGLCRFVSQDPQLDNYYLMDSYILLTNNIIKQIVLQVPDLNIKGSLRQKLLFENLNKITENGDVILFTNGPGYKNSKMSEEIPFINNVYDITGVNLFANSYGLWQVNRLVDFVATTDIKTYLTFSWLHSKIYLFDNILFSVGSLNFDETSVVASESALICYSDNIINDIKNTIIKDFNNSIKLVNKKNNFLFRNSCVLSILDLPLEL